MKGEKIMLSRKHYIKIANIIKDSTNTSDRHLLPTCNKVTLINRLGVMFKQDNINYNHSKFLDACDD